MRTRRAASAMEFALILPVFWMLFAGTMDWGWLFYHEAILDTAANEGCREASIIDPGVADEDLAYVEAVAREATLARLSDCDVGLCTVTISVAGAPPARTIECVVTREFEPLLGVALGPVTLGATIAMRMEWQRWN